MELELLYFDGCPTYKVALKDLEEVRRELGIDSEVTMVKVERDEDAEKLRFLGSPTIRVNGIDVDPSASDSGDYGLRCRVYRVDGKIVGYPSKETIRRALRSVS